MGIMFCSSLTTYTGFNHILSYQDSCDYTRLFLSRVKHQYGMALAATCRHLPQLGENRPLRPSGPDPAFLEPQPTCCTANDRQGALGLREVRGALPECVFQQTK